MINFQICNTYVLYLCYRSYFSLMNLWDHLKPTAFIITCRTYLKVNAHYKFLYLFCLFKSVLA